MQEQGMFIVGTRFSKLKHLYHQEVSSEKLIQQIFVSLHILNIITESPHELKDQFFHDYKLTVSFSSPPNSGRDNQIGIPEEEVVSMFIPDDNQSFTSNKHVRFIETQEKQVVQQKCRRQRSIPFPEKVQEDLIGETSQLSPYHKGQIRIKQQMNYSTNLLNDNLNGISLQNSFQCRTISSYDQMEQTNQLADELINIVKNYLNDISLNEKHFTFEEQEDENRNKFNIQQKVLKKALEHLNFKMNVALCSPISRISNTSPHFEDLQINYKDIQIKNEELNDQNELLKDRIEICDMKLLELYDNQQELQQQINQLQLLNEDFKQQLQNKDIELMQQIQINNNLKEQIQQYQKQYDQLIEKTKKQNIQQNIQKNNNVIKHKHHNSMHEVYCISPTTNIIIGNISTNSSQQSPKNSNISHNKHISLDDTIYFGNVQNEKKQGYGNLKKGDEKLYMGFWKDDKYDGFGYLKNKNIDYGNINIQNLNSVQNKWISYQGEFIDGQYNGYGIWTFSDNTRFHGMFQNGKAFGRGTYYSNTNTIIGIWNNNIKL